MLSTVFEYLFPFVQNVARLISFDGFGKAFSNFGSNGPSFSERMRRRTPPKNAPLPGITPSATLSRLPISDSRRGPRRSAVSRPASPPELGLRLPVAGGFRLTKGTYGSKFIHKFFCGKKIWKKAPSACNDSFGGRIYQGCRSPRGGRGPGRLASQPISAKAGSERLAERAR